MTRLPLVLILDCATPFGGATTGIRSDIEPIVLAAFNEFNNNTAAQIYTAHNMIYGSSINPTNL